MITPGRSVAATIADRTSGPAPDPGLAGDRSRLLLGAGIAAACAMLACFTTYQHEQLLGLAYLDHGVQLARHQAILAGWAGNPWQYRVLTAYVIEALMRGFRTVSVTHYAAGFILLRVVEDMLIFALSYVYFRKLRLGVGLSLIGIALLAWSITGSSYDSDLQLNTYLDVAFYLLAAICLLESKYMPIVPLTLMAALNRETSGLIPFMALAVALHAGPVEHRRRGVTASALSLAAFAIVFVGLREVFPTQPLLIPDGRHMGLDLLWYNVARPITWAQLMATLNIVPVLALLGYRVWPKHLVAVFWAVTPAWFAVHLVGAVAAESRLFLVPQAIVFVPGALLFAKSGFRPHASEGQAEALPVLLPVSAGVTDSGWLAARSASVSLEATHATDPGVMTGSSPNPA